MSKLSEIDAELGDLLGKRETIEGVDIRRVKACLAACKGIETETLEKFGIDGRDEQVGFYSCMIELEETRKRFEMLVWACTPDNSGRKLEGVRMPTMAQVQSAREFLDAKP